MYHVHLAQLVEEWKAMQAAVQQRRVRSTGLERPSHFGQRDSAAVWHFENIVDGNLFVELHVRCIALFERAHVDKLTIEKFRKLRATKADVDEGLALILGVKKSYEAGILGDIGQVNQTEMPTEIRKIGF